MSEPLNTLVQQPPRTLAGLIHRAIRIAPAGTALIYQDRRTSFAALESQVRQAAGGLRALGLGHGDRLALWMPTVPAYLVLYLACARLGVIAVAVNTRYRAGEVEDVLIRSGARALALWPDFRGIDFQAILADVPRAALDTLDFVIRYSESSTPPALPIASAKIVDYTRLIEHAPYEDNDGGPDAGSKMFTTSGTTSKPKFVLHPQSSITAHALDVAAGFCLHRPDGVSAIALPLTGVFGFNAALGALAAARPAILLPIFDEHHLLEQMRRYGVTQWNGSDEMVHRILEAGADEQTLARVDFVGYAAFDTALADIVARADTRGLKLVGLWGMSEMQALVAHRDPNADIEDRQRMGGTMVSADARVRVRDPQTGRLLGIGETGELEMRGPSRMAGYFGDPQATAEATTEDGYVRTGDLGRTESDRGFEFLARMGDVMRLGGFLVAPAEIEAEIQTCPGVGSVQVVAANSPLGPRSVAFVLPAAGAVIDTDAIREHCARRLARYKVPARIEAIEAFPVTLSANGTKIQKGRLRDMANTLLQSGAL